MELRSGGALSRELVVARGGVELAALLVESREQPVGDLGLPIALERARRGRDIAVQVRLDRRRAARERP